MAGYSGTPLPQKLGIKPAARVGLLGAPQGFKKTLGELPPAVKLSDATRGSGALDVIVAFVQSRRELERAVQKLKRRLEPAGGLWLTWPKKTAAIATELTEKTVREVGLASGLVDNKVCAIDDTWSGLRFVVRVQDRPKAARARPLV
ncbi:MAG TPA: hypothetical protein VGI10_29830 [Polyangiaceae bacterium]|jgi:hypothetical protein